MQDEVVECAVVHVFDEHEKCVLGGVRKYLVVVGEVVLHDVSALANSHHGDLFLQLLQILLVFNRNYAYCIHLLLVLLGANSIYLTHTTLSDLLEKTILKGWLRTAENNLFETALKLTGG